MEWGSLVRLSQRQFGLFTSGHAARLGVPGYQLARAAETGMIRRVRRGVYAFVDADEHPFEDLAAQWLVFDPVDPVARRRVRPAEIVSHDSAAMMRRLGKINDFGIRQFTASRRVNLHVPGVQMYRASFGPGDWSIVEGLPVATPLRIVADMMATPHDGDEIGSVIDDGLATGLFTRDVVVDVVDRHAGRWRYPDGSALVDGLLSSMDPRVCLSTRIIAWTRVCGVCSTRVSPRLLGTGDGPVSRSATPSSCSCSSAGWRGEIPMGGSSKVGVALQLRSPEARPTADAIAPISRRYWRCDGVSMSAE